MKVRDAREAYNEKDAPDIEEVPEDREPSLNGFTSQWDLKLFREAQVFFHFQFSNRPNQCYWFLVIIHLMVIRNITLLGIGS